MEALDLSCLIAASGQCRDIYEVGGTVREERVGCQLSHRKWKMSLDRGFRPCRARGGCDHRF